MKLKIFEINTVFQTVPLIKDLILKGKINLTFPEYRDFFHMCGLIEKETAVINDMRFQIAGKYALKDDNGEFIIDNDHYTFADDSVMNMFLKEIQELNITEINLEAEKLNIGSEKLNINDCPQIFDAVLTIFQVF